MSKNRITIAQLLQLLYNMYNKDNTKEGCQMIFNLDLESEVPIYQQFVDAIIYGIATRQLKPGEPLPSVRSLSADIGINMHTVNKAYQILKNDGFVLIHRQKGVMVNTEPPGVEPSFLEKLHANLKNLTAEAICRGLSREALVEQVQKIYQQMMDERRG